jgi:hypothetical protein
VSSRVPNSLLYTQPSSPDTLHRYLGYIGVSNSEGETDAPSALANHLNSNNDVERTSGISRSFSRYAQEDYDGQIAEEIVDMGSPEFKKVKALLSKLTTENFDSSSELIVYWMNKCEKEKDGHTLAQIVCLVFEKAVDNASCSNMYARLCRQMMDEISPQVRNEGIQNAEGRAIAGGQLFRKYLLNRCQEDFERGWEANWSTVRGQTSVRLEEYNIAWKARKRGLGLVRFMGELFNLSMLTDRIMHECIKKLLADSQNPKEDDMESLCELLTTVGPQLDTPKARTHIDIYFLRIQAIASSEGLSLYARTKLRVSLLFFFFSLTS